MRMPKLSLRFLRKLLPKRRDTAVDHDDSVDHSRIDNHISSFDDNQTYGRFTSSATNRTAILVATPEQSTHSTTKAISTASEAPLESATEPTEDCPICHDPVGPSNPEGIVESWTKLHCGHKFGSHCIQTWLQESIDRDQSCNPTCPICRTIARHHPCGHLVSPLATNSIFAGFYDIPSPAPPPRRRHGRRLTRRFGHPRRPMPSMTRRTAQNVGECQTCVANALFDARMKQWSEEQEGRERSSTAIPDSSNHAASSSQFGRRSSGRSLVLFPGFKRPSPTWHSFLEEGQHDSRRMPDNIQHCGPDLVFQLLQESRLSTPQYDQRLSF